MIMHHLAERSLANKGLSCHTWASSEDCKNILFLKVSTWHWNRLIDWRFDLPTMNTSHPTHGLFYLLLSCKKHQIIHCTTTRQQFLPWLLNAVPPLNMHLNSHLPLSKKFSKEQSFKVENNHLTRQTTISTVLYKTIVFGKEPLTPFFHSFRDYCCRVQTTFLHPSINLWFQIDLLMWF